MAHLLRLAITSRILENIRGGIKTSSKLPSSSQQYKNLFKELYSSIELKQTVQQPQFHISKKSLKKLLINNLNDESVFQPPTKESLKLSPTKEDQFSENINPIENDNEFIYKMDKNKFIMSTLKPNYQIEIENNLKSISQFENNKPEEILVEFSSPNIAKPFHVGHLRSTIIGNFISNLYRKFGHNVIRINYLGDWGTQFGYLKIGMDLSAYTTDEIKSDPIGCLYRAYVKANQLAAASDGDGDKNIAEKAKQIFFQLENSENVNLNDWNKYREFTVDELRRIYGRLGVEFDVYCWESDYRKTNIQSILTELIKKQILIKDDEHGGAFVCKLSDRTVPLIKSDGTTLYLTRDIAALMERSIRYQFDRLIYVVDNSQHQHFRALFEIGKRLNVPAIENVEHVKFGRIKNMSTRKGSVVFLNDILNEAQQIMRQKQIESLTTKIDVNNRSDLTDDILGMSAVIVNDLKQRRQRDYEFDWNKVLQVNGDTGVKLQYTHCRLWNLYQVNGIEPAEICQPELLTEPEAVQLIYEISRFTEILVKTELSLEPCIFVNYLFSLCNSISRALKKLNIKDHPNIEVKSQRMLLFCTSRQVLYTGMCILGLRPLNKM